MELWGKKKKMDCKEFERLIPGFIAGELDYLTLKSFSGHMEGCEGCREELVIQFLVTEGIQRLEDGNAFDLQAELDKRLEETRQQIRVHSIFMHIGTVMEIIAVGMLGGIVVWLLG